MLKTLVMSAAVSALMISGALAQANPPADSAAAPSMAAPLASPKFIQEQGMDQWVFSRFKGTNVLGPDNAHIGDVSDVLFDKSGRIDAFIVGVGGFLGIGEKSVAIDMTAFQVVPADTGATANRSNTTVSSNNDPTQVKLKVAWTKEQLKNAPDFQYYHTAARTTSGPAPSPTTGMAPRPTVPAQR